MPSVTFNSGKYGTAAVGTNEVPLTDWDVTPTTGLVTFINSMTSGTIMRQTTFEDISGSFGVDFNFYTGQNPFQSPFSLQIQAIPTTLNFYLHQASFDALNGLVWVINTPIIHTTPQRLMVDGKITTRFTFVGNGTFAYPTP